MRIAKYLFKFLLFFIFIPSLNACSCVANEDYGNEFLGARAYQDIEYQTSIGPRYIGSEGHEEMIKWLIDSLEEYGWLVENQELDHSGVGINNIIARNGGEGDWIIIGAHYDTRQFADQEPRVEDRAKPVIGANDGASGVAVLLELARVIPGNIEKNIWLVFFDAEDNGGINGGDWIMGSRAFVEALSKYPDEVVIVDMVGDADLQIFYERSSDSALSEEIWMHAAQLGHGEIFIPKYKYSIIDDHTPFLQAGIPAVDIIDFDYPYWHTTSDTLDKVSEKSLDIVGDTLLFWITSP